MIPKYYFLRMILQNEELCADIQPQPPLSPLQCYQKRRLLIQQKLDAAIEALPELSGPDILEIVRQREEILRRLDRHGSLWLTHQKEPFAKLLQRILRVTPAMIEGYSEALGRLLLDTDVTVLLDDGRTHLRVGNRGYIAKTVLDSSEPTVEKCEDLLQKLADYHCYPQKLTLCLPDGRFFDYEAATHRLTQREGNADQFRSQIMKLR